jgi:hypothetical protein
MEASAPAGDGRGGGGLVVCDLRTAAEAGLRLVFAVAGIVLIALHVAGKVEDSDAVSVAISDLPSVVVAAVEQTRPGATIASAEVEEEDGEQLYEVTVVDGGVEYEIDVSPTGAVLEVEQEDDSGDWTEETFVLVAGVILLVVGCASSIHFWRQLRLKRLRRSGASEAQEPAVP